MKYLLYVVPILFIARIFIVVKKRHPITFIHIKKRRKTGLEGEKQVRKILKQLPDSSFRVYNDILLKIGNTTSQIDHIVISPYGIFVIETKNYKGIIRAEDNNTRWFQSINNTKEKEIDNPLRQNERHVKVLAYLLNIKDYTIFKPIITFSREANVLVQSFKQDICYYDKLLNVIEDHYVKCIFDSDIEKYCKYIDENNIISKKAREEHIQSINSTRKKLIQSDCSKR